MQDCWQASVPYGSTEAYSEGGNMKRPRGIWLFSAAILTTLLTLAPTTFQFRFGTMTRPLSGSRYETMRALSHYLDAQASHAFRIAQRTTHPSSYSGRRVVQSMARFSNRADDFHERMDRYLDNRWDLPPEVISLDRSARDVSYDLRRSNSFPRVYDDWNDVLNTLDLMKRVLAGEHVIVPRAHAGYRGNGPYEYENDRYNQNDQYNDTDQNQPYDYDHDHDHQ
jgi:hypothetical protein